MNRREFLRYGAFGLIAADALAKPSPKKKIVRCAIHPAIGVARVGNSPDEYFLCPEVPGPEPMPVGGFKDPVGRIKRQAARFRIYGLDADGNVVKELTSADAEIIWRVHLANKKAAWYDFEVSLDIPEAAGLPNQLGATPDPPLAVGRRNANLQGADRAKLVIDPGPRTISGRNINVDGNGSAYAFDSGRFFDRSVPLGELRTDERGRLLVFGGFGSSGPAVPGTGATTFANNEGWQDDISDGPVDATVRIGDHVMSAKGAWVVVGPPDYAPGIEAVVTMYDVVFDVAMQLEPARAPRRPSFSRQIYPILERHVRHEWVNAGFFRDFGWGSPGNFLEPKTLRRLASRSEENRFVRDAVFRRFRNPGYVRQENGLLPPYYGDAIALPMPTGPRQWMALLPTQYESLRRWAAGDFDADWPAAGLRFPKNLEELPIAEQPAALDRAALDGCLGGPFHPGCELTWPMRVPLLYESPFRIRRRQGPEPDWGDELTSAIALDARGPLCGSGPGDLTRWMAVPWQTDTSSCLAGYEPALDTYLPTFWPARVPNQILALQNYLTIIDPRSSRAQKQAAFADRAKWLRDLPAQRSERLPFMNKFVEEWSRYGIVMRQSGPRTDSNFPAEFWVEVGYDRNPG